MKNVNKKLIRGEQGAALILVLVVLLVGGLIAGGLLQHMGAGLLSGEVYNRRTAELYAADAGVEDAIWKIQHGETPVCPANPDWSYYITDINGKTLQISIGYVGEGIYRITSTAVTPDGGNTAAIDSSTTIESYVSASFMDFSSLLDYAIVSNETIDIQPNVCINGSVWLPYEEGLSVSPNSEITGDNVTLSDGVSPTWPTFDQLSAYYLTDVNPGDPYPNGTVDISVTKTLGPCYRYGGLAIDNTGGTDTLVLEGTVYVDNGDLDFEQAGSHGYTIDLSGHTIFVDGDIDFPSNVVTISGSGCIIATGNIDFHPSISSSEDDFVLVMSIEGTVTVQPNGDFTGCVVGNEVVQLQPAQGEDFTITWISPEGQGLDFPMGTGDDPNELPPVTGVKIESWEASQQ